MFMWTYLLCFCEIYFIWNSHWKVHRLELVWKSPYASNAPRKKKKTGNLWQVGKERERHLNDDSLYSNRLTNLTEKIISAIYFQIQMEMRISIYVAAAKMISLVPKVSTSQWIIACTFWINLFSRNNYDLR